MPYPCDESCHESARLKQVLEADFQRVDKSRDGNIAFEELLEGSNWDCAGEMKASLLLSLQTHRLQTFPCYAQLYSRLIIQALRLRFAFQPLFPLPTLITNFLSSLLPFTSLSHFRSVPLLSSAFSPITC